MNLEHKVFNVIHAEKYNNYYEKINNIKYQDALLLNT